jgi:ectoine hydroxylase-related dioxygenase (phytanoyl-CoA dioxygenase family)
MSMSLAELATIPRFDRHVAAAEVAAALRTHGCAVVERLADAELCDRVQAELAPYVAVTPTGGDEFTGANTRRTGALLARSPSSAEMVAHPLVLEVCDQVLWEKKTTFQLHLTQAITIGPGAEAQYLHRDQWCFDFFPFPDDVQVEVSTIWALDDFTEANGATRVIPGSHLATDTSGFTADDTMPAEMPRGSVVLYTGRTVHGGGANTSDGTRTGVNVDYVLGWLRQEENQYLSVPIEVVRTLPEPVQRLMGYTMGAYALGYIDDVRDPMSVLRDPRDPRDFAGSGASSAPDPDAGSSFAPR